jgi:four helix bundle protein
MLSFQRLDVYQRSIDFIALTHAVTAGVPRGHASAIDQLRRAATSVSLNIAEAAGRRGAADAARAYAIARGSAMECAAALDALKAMGIVEERLYAEGTRLLERVVAMLTKMCR